ncbi:uncharacterized protein ACBR49_010597 isoform 2-T2 [Aulostomus maculatus]
MTAEEWRRDSGLTPERVPHKKRTRNTHYRQKEGGQDGPHQPERRNEKRTKTKDLKTTNAGMLKKSQDEGGDAKVKKLKADMVEEERESMLVAGIRLHEMTRDDEEDEDDNEGWKRDKKEGGEDVKVDSVEVSISTPPQPKNEAYIPTTPQNPPPLPHRGPLKHPVPPSQAPPIFSHPLTPHAKVHPPFSPLSATLPKKTHPISASRVSPGDKKSVSLIEDLLIEVFHSPRHHLSQLQEKPKSGETTVTSILREPETKDLQTTHKDTRTIKTIIQTKERDFFSEARANISAANPTHNPKTLRLTLNEAKHKAKQNKASAAQTEAKSTAFQTPSAKTHRGSRNMTVKKSKERGKNNKSRKPERKEVTTPTYFPFFLENYCPPDCACYGRVVQCSDKGVDKFPYGIPYNSRYVLLMNNHISSLPLDLLSEYVSMEFLVLSNNRLTDGAIEGALGGVPALKRLYLDRNFLAKVPTDLPVSLEELRLDNNQLRVMSEVTWARCPGLLVLSLSNNSLGNESESLPDAVFSPLCHLRTLNLDYNQLISVPLGLPLSIKELYLKGNLIEQFRGGAFNGTSELLVLDLSSNKLTNKGLPRDALLSATHLESLNLEGNRLKQVPRHLPTSLKTLNLEGNLISSIKRDAFKTFKYLEHLGLARNRISKVVPGAFRALPALHQLDLCHNSLQHVPRQLPRGLHSVALTHNKIQAVPRDAFCWGNNSVSLSGLVRVQLENNLIDIGTLDSQAFRCLRGFQVVHFY